MRSHTTSKKNLLTFRHENQRIIRRLTEQGLSGNLEGGPKTKSRSKLNADRTQPSKCVGEC